jgi:hypothetical protein
MHSGGVKCRRLIPEKLFFVSSKIPLKARPAHLPANACNVHLSRFFRIEIRKGLPRDNVFQLFDYERLAISSSQISADSIM